MQWWGVGVHWVDPVETAWRDYRVTTLESIYAEPTHSGLETRHHCLGVLDGRGRIHHYNLVP